MTTRTRAAVVRADWAVFVLALLVGACGSQSHDHSAQPSGGEQIETQAAPILNAESPDRIPGAFIVELKPREELAALVKSSRFRPSILPGQIPDSEGSLAQFAEAMAEAAHARVKTVLYSKLHLTFVLEEVSDEALSTVIVRDPRVRYVEPDMRTTH